MNKDTWLIEGEVGTSSRTMWLALMGMIDEPRRLDGFNLGVPHDPDDFRRCLLLIRNIPEFREKLSEVSKAFPAWEPYIREWEKLETVLGWLMLSEKSMDSWIIITAFVYFGACVSAATWQAYMNWKNK